MKRNWLLVLGLALAVVAGVLIFNSSGRTCWADVLVHSARGSGRPSSIGVESASRRRQR